MNSKQLFSRGTKYALDAEKNWRSRKLNILIKLCRKSDSFDQLRVVAIMQTLDKRLKDLSKFYYDAKQKQEVEAIIAGEQMIILQCRNISCQPSNKTMLGMPIRSYLPGEHKCMHCDSVLMSEDEHRVDYLFDELELNF